MLVEPSQRRDASRDAGRAQTAGPQALEVPDDIVGAGAAQCAVLVVEELGEVGQIATVGTESISGGPPLCLEGAEILDYDIGHRVTTSDSITTSDNREGRAAEKTRFVVRAASGFAVAPATTVEIQQRGALGDAEHGARRPENAGADRDHHCQPRAFDHERRSRRP